jgi:hypothetical protein
VSMRPYSKVREHKTFQLQQPEMKMLDCERYTRFGSCWFQRKMVCWGGVRPRPGRRLPPLEGGAGSHAMGCVLSSRRCASHR